MEIEMKCPNCGYEHGFKWDNETQEGGNVDGEHGDFFKSPLTMSREEFYSKSEWPVFGCPSCKIVFIGD
jgi:predicted RNA-binding Zn-ribbon protein involved in translation (DUF1610 family)